MKKVVSCLFISLVAMMISISSVCAFDTIQIDNAYNKLYSFYKTKDELRSYNEIIGVESLGLEAESFKLPDIASVDFETSTIGDLTKAIISLILIGNDPHDFKGQNLIEMLESCIKSDGTVEKNGYTADNSVLAWTLYALESYQSDKVDLVAEKLLSTRNSNGSFGYGNGTESVDITGWCLEALVIAGFSEQLNETKEYLLNNERYGENGMWGYSWGSSTFPNTTSQACALIGLLTSDRDELLNGSYNYNDKNPLDVLAATQNNDGTFWDDEGISNGGYETFDTLRALGTYKNGSVIYRAQQDYKEIIESKTEESEQPKQPETENKEVKEENQNTVSESVKTGDSTHVSIFISLMVLSGVLYLNLRKNEKNHSII